MLAQKLDAVSHEHHGIQRRTAAVGRHRRVGRDAVEQKAGAIERQLAPIGDAVMVRRMPLKHHVHVAKQTGADHIHLTRTAFFSRRAIVSQRSRHAIRLQVFLERDRGKRGS